MQYSMYDENLPRSTNPFVSSPLQESFSTSPTASAYNSPSNSKSVISALKALQDKIRKLENERQVFEEVNAKLEKEAQELRGFRERERRELRNSFEQSYLSGTSKEDSLLQQVERKSQERQSVIEQTSINQQNAMKTLREQIQSLERELKSEQVGKDFKSKYSDSQEMNYIPNFNYEMPYKPKTISSPYISPFELDESQILSKSTLPNVTMDMSSIYSSQQDSASQQDQNKVSGAKRKQPSGENPVVLRVPPMPFIIGKSNGKSFHVAANIQKAISLINQHTQVSIQKLQSQSPQRFAKPSRICSKHQSTSCATSGRENDHIAAAEEAVATEEHLNQERAESEAREWRLFDQEIDFVLQSIQDELDQLTKHYQSLVTQRESNKKESIQIHSSIYDSSIQQTIEKIEQKNQQLEFLRKYHNRMKRISQSPKKNNLYNGKRLQQTSILHGFQEFADSMQKL